MVVAETNERIRAHHTKGGLLQGGKPLKQREDVAQYWKNKGPNKGVSCICPSLQEGLAYLANINVRAVLVNLRVIGIERSRVDARNKGDSVAGIIRLHDVSGQAVLASVTETDYAVGLEVGACRVDYAGVNGCQLVAVYQI